MKDDINLFFVEISMCKRNNQETLYFNDKKIGIFLLNEIFDMNRSTLSHFKNSMLVNGALEHLQMLRIFECIYIMWCDSPKLNCTVLKILHFSVY